LEKIIGVDPEIKENIKKLIRAREDARRGKDFKKADEIRNKLLKQDIILEDTKIGTVWRRKV